jgi:hypothetical protein
MKGTGWLILALGGLIGIIIELVIPDFVPDIINDLISQKYASEATGLVPFLHAFLIIYYFAGIASFIGGIFGFIRSNSGG